MELDRRLQQPPPGEGGASSSGVDRSGPGASTGGLSSEERSRRNQEFAELTSDTNMAAMHGATGEDGEDDLNEVLERENDIEQILQLERPPEENRRRLAEVGRATAREGLRRMLKQQERMRSTKRMPRTNNVKKAIRKHHWRNCWMMWSSRLEESRKPS